MLNCFITDKPTANTIIPISLITPKTFSDWLLQQSDGVKEWLAGTQFRGEAGTFRLLPDASGKIARVICSIADLANFWGAGSLPMSLPEGLYSFDEVSDVTPYAISWGLGAYQFARYKKPLREPAKLLVPLTILPRVKNMVESIYLVRDWVNTPTDDMGPSEFAAAAEEVAKEFGAQLTQIVGDELLRDNYASIHTVGRASDDAPRLIDMRWGNSAHPKVTLVGKGVCFDTGGLDIKASNYMLLMKKDMGGGAHVFGLARMIMAAKLPVRLRVLVPVVENAISGNAYRPGDVIKSRKGLTIEIGNTDAEGRVILADALTEAVSEKPELLIDIATLTGAARIALGTELPALFANNDSVAADVIRHGKKNDDPVWRLPLFSQYRELLNSTIADINNNASESYGGAITAAIFLKEFVPDDIPWLHFDLMAWNQRARPGRPQGGEAMALRALFSYLTERFASS
jgi:leucyl aminopeptidase